MRRLLEMGCEEASIFQVTELYRPCKQFPRRTTRSGVDRTSFWIQP